MVQWNWYFADYAKCYYNYQPHVLQTVWQIFMNDNFMKFNEWLLYLTNVCILTDENTDQQLKTCLPYMEKYKGGLQSLVWTPTTKSVNRSGQIKKGNIQFELI